MKAYPAPPNPRYRAFQVSTRGQTNKVLVIVGIGAIALIVLLVFLMGKQSVGKAIYVSGEKKFDIVYRDNNLIVELYPTQGFTGVYFELTAQGHDICALLQNDLTKVSNIIDQSALNKAGEKISSDWNSGFYVERCRNGKLVFSDNDLNGLHPQTSTVPIAALSPKLEGINSLNLKMEKLDIYDEDSGDDMFNDDPYTFQITIQCIPVTETCDDKDNNCDGQVDEGCCTSATLNFCKNSQNCVAQEGVWDGTKCIACTKDSQCGDGKACLAERCKSSCSAIKLQDCKSAEECTSNQGVWDGTICKSCMQDSECGTLKECNGQNLCSALPCGQANLEACTTQLECGVYKGVWDGTNCKHCAQDSDCKMGEKCNAEKVCGISCTEESCNHESWFTGLDQNTKSTRCQYGANCALSGAMTADLDGNNIVNSADAQVVFGVNAAKLKDDCGAVVMVDGAETHQAPCTMGGVYFCDDHSFRKGSQYIAATLCPFTPKRLT